MTKFIPLILLIVAIQSCAVQNTIHQFNYASSSTDSSRAIVVQNTITPTYIELVISNTEKQPITIHWNESSLIVNGFGQPLLANIANFISLQSSSDLNLDRITDGAFANTNTSGFIENRPAPTTSFLVGESKHRVITSSFNPIDYYEMAKKYGSEKNLIVKDEPKVKMFEFEPDSASKVDIKIFITYSKQSNPQQKYYYEETYKLTNVNAITKGSAYYVKDYKSERPYFITTRYGSIESRGLITGFITAGVAAYAVFKLYKKGK